MENKETKEEALENWYLWLERRIRPSAPKGSSKTWIKAALLGYYEQRIKDND